MTPYEVVFAPEAGEQLEELFVYIAGRASAATAQRYTTAIVADCESLAIFPKLARRATTFVRGCGPRITKAGR